MPSLKRSPADRELERLIGLFLRAETDIINEIGRLRSLGLADYHAEAALERVQGILRRLENDCWEYAPKMIERQFYVHHPEARRELFPPESVAKHRQAYENAQALTGEQIDIIQRLTMNLMGEITEANVTAMNNLENILLGRRENDLFRRVGLEQTAAMQAAGRGAYRALPGFVEVLRREGVTAFVDRAGRKWSLHTYGSMVLRTTSRQAEVLSVLTESPEQDLYQISRHGTTCKLCAPFEGRVYSKSGQSREFPPLSAAFGKVDRAGPDSLANSWLNIHPNCLHMLIPWTPAGRTEEEIQQIKDFSDPRKNPFDRDPRTREQIEAYRKKEAARAKWLRDYRQWERYREILGDRAPKRFETFLAHKRAGDEKYKQWERDYRKATEAEKYSRVRYHEDGTIVVTDVWNKHQTIPMNYRTNAIVETRFSDQTDRIYYDSSGRMAIQIHSGDHGYPKQHSFGDHGEHTHEFVYDDDGNIVSRFERELTDAEREENGDIL